METTTTAASAPTVPVAGAGAVVVAVDGSEHAGIALTWAARQASATRRQLVLVHVTEPMTSSYLDAVGIDYAALDRECFAHESALVEDAATTVLKGHPDLQVHRLVLRGDARGSCSAWPTPPLSWSWARAAEAPCAPCCSARSAPPSHGTRAAPSRSSGPEAPAGAG